MNVNCILNQNIDTMYHYTKIKYDCIKILLFEILNLNNIIYILSLNYLYLPSYLLDVYNKYIINSTFINI